METQDNIKTNATESLMKKLAIPLTKKNISDFISWSTTKYNDYLGYGTKKEAVNTVFYSFIYRCKMNASIYYKDTKFYKKGDVQLQEYPEINSFKIKCSGSCGENSTGKYWRIKQGGGEYLIDCESMSIMDLKKDNLMMFFRLSNKQLDMRKNGLSAYLDAERTEPVRTYIISKNQNT